jgi:uncharacterized membrane protein
MILKRLPAVGQIARRSYLAGRTMMTLYQMLFQALAISIPVVALAAMVRLLAVVYRSLVAQRHLIALYSLLAIIGMALILAAVVVVWFAYGVGHGHKDLTSDLVLIGVTVPVVYGAALGCWYLARRLDRSVRQPDV